jgi:multicomponent Na+:H+ antiporter subunit A
MPVTFLAGALAAISMAGIPPMVGFIGKEFLYKAGLGLDTAGLWVTGTIFAASVLMFVAAGISVARPFLGRLPEHLAATHEGPTAMWLGPLLLGALSLTFGLFSGVAETWLIGPATWAVYGETVSVDLYLFREVNAAFLLSLATFAAGIVLYLGHRRLRRVMARAIEISPLRFDPGWDRTLDGLKALAHWQTQILQSGVLQRYMVIVFATLAAGLGATIWLKDAFGPVALDFAEEFDGLVFKHWAVLVFITAGALLTAWTSSRMTAVAALGVVGIGVALVFIMFSAPDVAITQLLVETLTVVLVAVAMLKLPHLNLRREPRRPAHAVLAMVVGTIVALILVAVEQGDIDRRITDYFEAASWPEAYGRNIVNVILVDFRALDTFGEIAVVVIAALSAYALLRGTRYRRDEEEES